MKALIDQNMMIRVNKKTPTKNFIGINDTFSTDHVYTVSILITVFDILYRLNPRYWQRMNSEPYDVLNSNEIKELKVTNNKDEYLYLIADDCFYVSSVLTCVLLSDYIYENYNRKPRIMPSHIDIGTKKYMYSVLHGTHIWG